MIINFSIIKKSNFDKALYMHCHYPFNITDKHCQNHAQGIEYIVESVIDYQLINYIALIGK